MDDIPIDDPEVYKIFARGQTEGIFQFESSGMKQMLMNLKPTKLEHLIAANSLYRPGPAKQIDTFVENSHNPEKVHYSTPLFKTDIGRHFWLYCLSGAGYADSPLTCRLFLRQS